MKYKCKGPGQKWTNEDVHWAVSRITQRDVSIVHAADLFLIPYSTLKPRKISLKRKMYCKNIQ